MSFASLIRFYPDAFLPKMFPKPTSETHDVTEETTETLQYDDKGNVVSRKVVTKKVMRPKPPKSPFDSQPSLSVEKDLSKLKLDECPRPHLEVNLKGN